MISLTQTVGFGSWIAAVCCVFAMGSLVAQERTSQPTQKPTTPIAVQQTTIPSDTAPLDEDGRLILEGVVTTIWTCPLPNKNGEHADKMTYLLWRKDGSPIELDIPAPIMASWGGYTALWGKTVSVHGAFQRGESKVFEVATLGVLPPNLPTDPDAPSNSKPAPVVSGFLGPARPFLNILTRFSDTVSTSDLPKSAYTSLFANAYPGLDHYWRDQSYGQTTLEGSTLMGWITLPNPRAFYTTNGSADAPLDWMKTILATMDAVDASVNFRKYYGINVLVNTSLGDAGGKGGAWWGTRDGETRAWGITLDGSGAGQRHDHGLMTHEMGHSLGLSHSSGTNNKPSPWDTMSSGFIFDPIHGRLGSGTIAYQRILRHYLTQRYNPLGGYVPSWIPQERRYTVYNRGIATIRLDALGATPGANYHMATVHIRGDMTRFYTVEARLKTAYDQFPRTGVIIHRVHLFRAQGEGESAQVMTDPAGAPAGAPAGLWEAGETYKDTENGITIKVNDITATSCGITLTVSKEANPINVVNTADSGSGSLRNALLYANEFPGTRIRFKIPATAPSNVGGVFRIALLSPLPEIRGDGTIVDGLTQTMFAGNTNIQGPEVLLDGTNAGDWTPGLYVTASNVRLRGLAIGGFKSDGIRIDGFYGASGSRIEQCYVGTDATGTVALPNGGSGIAVYQGATNTTIGGTTATSRCVVSGNLYMGIYLSDKVTQITRIQQNYIGTNAKGNIALPNGRDGVIVLNGAGTVTTLNNVISGNTYSGCLALGSANLVFQGNKIGVDVTGTKAIGNGGTGVWCGNAASNITIGGASASLRNLISGNSGDAITFDNASAGTIQGNYLGVDATGLKALSNGGRGVASWNGSSNIVIGGSNASLRNIIAGNKIEGISLSNTSNATIAGNYIGTNAAGTLPIPNEANGISLWGGTTNSQIGGGTAELRNIISGNLGAGITFAGQGTANNRIQGNYIGLDVMGLKAMGNGGDGVISWDKPNAMTIGGMATGLGNVIANNKANGISLAQTTNSILQGNIIGSDITGKVAMGNQGFGVALWDGCQNNQIGGTKAGARNIIVANKGSGVVLAGPTNTNNRIQGNYIGVDITGLKAMGNRGDGIGTWGGATGNFIGGTVLGAGNLISSNTGNGLGMYTCINTTVQGNIIGADITGKVAMGNQGYGVALGDGTTGANVGGTTLAARNIIVANKDSGVALAGETNHDNIIQGNYIGLDITGLIVLPNVNFGIEIRSGSHNNQIGGTGVGNTIRGGSEGVRLLGAQSINCAILQNSISACLTKGIALYDGANKDVKPTALSAATANAIRTTVLGNLKGVAKKTYRIEFFSNAPTAKPQGETYLGFLNVTTNAAGSASFTFTTASLAADTQITATATDPTGNTSEFSAARKVIK